MPCTQDYSMRLREEAQRELAPRIVTLKENLRSLQQSFAESLSQFEEKTRDIGSFQLAAAESIVTEAVDQAARQKDEEITSLANFIVDIQKKETQEEILSLFLDMALRYASRLILFVVRGADLTCWSSRGFSEDAAARINSFSMEQDKSPALKEALESGRRISVSDVSGETTLLSLVPEEVRSPWHVFPMKAMQRPVAVLMAFDAEGNACRADTLLAITAITQLCIENIALKILRELETQYAGEPVPVATGSEALPAEAKEPLEPVAEVAPAQREPDFSTEPVPASADISDGDVPYAETQVVSEPESVQSIAPDAETHIEEEIASNAVEAEPLAQETPEVQIISSGGESTPASLSDAIVMALAEPVSEAVSVAPVSNEKAKQLSEEEKNHADAKRFARLLVSEIKLYNERRVLDGRRNRDIYVRLKKDIDRSREMYAQRVSPSVARKVDYFHDEVLRILGDNDPSTLGSDYPGPEIAS
jgi:hypothetical protein